jgi:hypothetical protein
LLLVLPASGGSTPPERLVSTELHVRIFFDPPLDVTGLRDVTIAGQQVYLEGAYESWDLIAEEQPGQEGYVTIRTGWKWPDDAESDLAAGR